MLISLDLIKPKLKHCLAESDKRPCVDPNGGNKVVFARVQITVDLVSTPIVEIKLFVQEFKLNLKLT